MYNKEIRYGSIVRIIEGFFKHSEAKVIDYLFVTLELPDYQYKLKIDEDTTVWIKEKELELLTK